MKKTKTDPQPLKDWRHNERCLCKNRRARFGKYTHNGKRASVTVCVAGESGEILNWQNQNVALTDLTEYPNPMPTGFWWDENGVLCWPAPSEKSPADDSLNPTIGENQNSPADDSLNPT
ncbi:hypothetical protein NG798_23340, partial [Ancylothrix sp. C2]|uniref:hypothetical protein n=1 Tax=Ancylothrix sp. D3o TaxID=2953691 RepID=UPI0021BB9120